MKNKGIGISFLNSKTSFAIYNGVVNDACCLSFFEMKKLDLGVDIQRIP